MNNFVMWGFFVKFSGLNSGEIRLVTIVILENNESDIYLSFSVSYKIPDSTLGQFCKYQ